MMATPFLAAMVLGWAMACCAVYALLRWLSVSLTLAIRSAGAWTLVVWVMYYVGTVSSNRFWSNGPYPLKLTVGIGAAIIGGFVVGSLLLRLLPPRSELWWHDVLFCALFLGCAHVWRYALLVSWPTRDGVLYDVAQWNGEVRDSHLLMFGVWLFPLGAPLMEVIVRAAWRLQRELSGQDERAVS